MKLLYIGDCYTIEENGKKEIVLTVKDTSYGGRTWKRYDFVHVFKGKNGSVTNTKNTINGKPDTDYYESGETFDNTYDLFWTISDMLSNNDDKASEIIDKIKPLIFE